MTPLEQGLVLKARDRLAHLRGRVIEAGPDPARQDCSDVSFEHLRSELSKILQMLNVATNDHVEAGDVEAVLYPSGQ